MVLAQGFELPTSNPDLRTPNLQLPGPRLRPRTPNSRGPPFPIFQMIRRPTWRRRGELFFGQPARPRVREPSTGLFSGPFRMGLIMSVMLTNRAGGFGIGGRPAGRMLVRGRSVSWCSAASLRRHRCRSSRLPVWSLRWLLGRSFMASSWWFVGSVVRSGCRCRRSPRGRVARWLSEPRAPDRGPGSRWSSSAVWSGGRPTGACGSSRLLCRLPRSLLGRPGFDGLERDGRLGLLEVRCGRRAASGCSPSLPERVLG
jgi:hypothetical protein